MYQKVVTARSQLSELVATSTRHAPMRTTRLIALTALPSARRTPLGAGAETQGSRWLLQALELVHRLAAPHDSAVPTTDVLSVVKEQREGQLLLAVMSTQQPEARCSTRS